MTKSKKQVLTEKLEKNARRTLYILDCIKQLNSLSDDEFRTRCNRDRYYVRTSGNNVHFGILLKEHGRLERNSRESCWDVHDRIYDRKLTKQEFESGLKNAIAFYEQRVELTNSGQEDLKYLKLILAEHEATPYEGEEK